MASVAATARASSSVSSPEDDQVPPLDAVDLEIQLAPVDEPVRTPIDAWRGEALAFVPLVSVVRDVVIDQLVERDDRPTGALRDLSPRQQAPEAERPASGYAFCRRET